MDKKVDKKDVVNKNTVVKDGLKKKSPDVRLERKTYFETKRRALKYEEENYTELVVLRTPNTLKNGKYWWKLFGHSAIFYKHWVSDQLKIKVRLLPDSDYEVCSEEGCVSIDDIDAFQDKLKTLKIYPKTATDNIRIYKLGLRITEQDYVMMRQEDETRIEMANKLILPEDHVTDLHSKTKDVVKLVHEGVRKMDGATRGSFGNDMERKAVQLQIIVMRAARGTIEIDDCLNKAYDIAEDLYGYMSVLLGLRMLEPKKMYVITEAVVALETQIKKEFKKRALRNVDEEVKEKIKEIRKLDGKK